MKKLLKKIFDYLNPNSLTNINKSISHSKIEAESYNLDISIFNSSEKLIAETSDVKLKYQLKVNLKNELYSLISNSKEYLQETAW